jgi:haloalkane dehalogenase
MTETTKSSFLTSADGLQRKRIDALDSNISFVTLGHGDPIVFLHGNPTPSYLWRNVIPHVANLGHCLAPDLIGMGESGKSPSGAYRFIDHARYLDEWFDSLSLTRNVVLVLHDWGSALGFHWAHRHPDRVQAIAYMEAIVFPRRWADFPSGHDATFRALRSPKGESMIFDDNFFVETVLPAGVIRKLTDDEMNVYRYPFHKREDRLPTLVWPRELPIAGQPANVVKIVSEFGWWLATSSIPKLFIAAEPGASLVGRARGFCQSWANQKQTTVKGIHFLQEDSPAEIGCALANFVRELRGSSTI